MEGREALVGKTMVSARGCNRRSLSLSLPLPFFLFSVFSCFLPQNLENGLKIRRERDGYVSSECIYHFFV